jgi:hypothetical protein
LLEHKTLPGYVDCEARIDRPYLRQRFPDSLRRPIDGQAVIAELIGQGAPTQHDGLAQAVQAVSEK